MRGRIDVLEPAPPRSADEDGGSGGWSLLVTAADRFEAELLRGLLEEASVPVVLDSFDRSPFAWMYPSGNAQAPVRVLVPTGLLEAAKLELLESSLVDASRLSDASAPGRATPAGADEPGSGRLLADRIRPTWIVVAVLTALVVAWIIIVEVAGFVPCATHLFCIR